RRERLERDERLLRASRPGEQHGRTPRERGERARFPAQVRKREAGRRDRLPEAGGGRDGGPPPRGGGPRRRGVRGQRGCRTWWRSAELAAFGKPQPAVERHVGEDLRLAARPVDDEL